MSLELRVDKDLSLHLLEPQDAAEIFAVIEANREHISAWLPWPNTTRCEQDLADFAGQNLSDFSTRKAMTLVIRERGQVVGGVGWTDWLRGHRLLAGASRHRARDHDAVCGPAPRRSVPEIWPATGDDSGRAGQ